MAIVKSELGLLLHTRLAALATSAWPAWLWSADGSRILWANAVGAAIFGASTTNKVAQRPFDLNGRIAAQIVRLAVTLPTSGLSRLERLRNFGAGFGSALTCACSRIVLPDSVTAVLVVATEPAGPSLTLCERVRRLFADHDHEKPLAVFTPDGALVHATEAARQRLGPTNMLAALHIGDAAAAALAAGSASGMARVGTATSAVDVVRLGEDASQVLALMFGPKPTEERAEPKHTREGKGSEQTVEPVSVAAAQQSGKDELLPASSSLQPSSAAADAARQNVSRPEPAAERRHPLRFVWQMDADGRFVVGSDEFIDLVGPRTMATFGRPWREIASELKLDPEDQVERAAATRETWSGITLLWPIDETDERLPVELAGLPVFDRDRHFRGYRGFGVCRDVARINRLSRSRQDRPIGFVAAPEATSPDGGSAPATPSDKSVAAAPARSASTLSGETPAAEKPVTETSVGETPVAEKPAAEKPAADAAAPEVAPQNDRAPPNIAPVSANVVPFRPGPSAEPKAPSLSPVERTAFRELAQELTARLRGTPEASTAAETIADGLSVDEQRQERSEASAVTQASMMAAETRSDTEGVGLKVPPNQSSGLEPLLVDRVPIGVLVYQHDRLIFANRRFFELSGFENLDVLAAAGGLNALFAGSVGTTLAETGDPQSLAIVKQNGDRLSVEGRLLTLPWQGEPALALFLTDGQGEERNRATAVALAVAQREIHALKSILDTTMDGVIVLDRERRMVSINAGAQALFGVSGGDFDGHPLMELLAPESRHAARECFDRVAHGVTVLHSAVNVTARTAENQFIPLAMIVARIGGDRFCAAFRDATVGKKIEEELRAAKREVQKSAAAKAEFLAKVSHEIRTPLNAITGFAEVIMAERFGPVGNERYREYLKDMHAAGTHLVSLLNDLLDLSKIETGKLDLNFANVNLNDLTQQCVGIMQPQANRARIIIRSSLTPGLPHVVADERSLRQIALNLLSNSIRFTGPGGQVIVSTAVTDTGEAVLRVRDTGVGMSEKDVETALEPFRQVAISGSWGSGGTGLGLPLTKALAEANRANFSIKTAPNAGTLVEIAFPRSRVLAD